jgi:hypothetical protein
MSDLPNQVLWRKAFIGDLRGFYPKPETATRIDKYATNAGNATVILYTVPANKLLFVSSAWLAARAAAGSSGVLYFGIRNAADVLVVYILTIILHVITQGQLANQYKPGIEVPAGYDVFTLSTNAALACEAGFSGWLESV